MMCLSGLRQLKLFFKILRLMPSDPALYFFAIEKKIMQISVLPLLDIFLLKSNGGSHIRLKHHK